MNRAWPVVLVVALGIAAGAAAEPRQDFYKVKKQALSEKAYARAERRLARVHVGMSQAQFFEAMEMMVLTHEKKKVDSLVEGYLRAEGRDGLPIDYENPREERYLHFGYLRDGREARKVTVVFRDDRVNRIVEEEAGAFARIWGSSDPNS